jgi:hypothetical protein
LGRHRRRPEDAADLPRPCQRDAEHTDTAHA